MSDFRQLRTEFPCGVWVSTVHLPLMHRDGLYETMVFPNFPEDEECRRYGTPEEAAMGHDEAVSRWAANLGEQGVGR